MKDNFLIVIGRQYGSGGRRIAKMLAEELGIICYDKNLLNKEAESMSYSSRMFTEKDERRPSLIRSILSLNYGAQSMAEIPFSDENVYSFQSNVIRRICERESCVMVGRTADYVMREHPRMVSLFIHAPLDQRVKMVLNREKIVDEKEAVDVINRHDKNRMSYYNYYTNSDGWGRAENYDLTLDSSRISDAAILAIVKDILKIYDK